MPDTFVAGEGGHYGTAVAGNLVYGQPGLVGIDDQMRLVAELATDVPTLGNGGAVMVGDGTDQQLETTFRLRQNATFSDGTPVTADDVVFSWKLSLNPAWPAQAGNDLESKYSDVVAVDPHTVVFKMKPSVIHPLYLYGLPDVWIYPSARLGSLVDFDPLHSLKVADSSIPPISEFFNPNTPRYPFNPDQARSILDAAGWTPGADGIRVNAQGKRLSFKYQSTPVEIRNKTMALVKDQLAAVGVEVNIDQMPGQAFFGRSGPLVQGTFDLAEYATIGTQDSGADVVTPRTPVPTW